jgi:uncharacterized RDD family membrane protein YckC
MSAGMPPAGWYDDPEYSGQLRWWDGATWTNDRTPAAQPQQTEAPVMVGNQAGGNQAASASGYGSAGYESSAYGAVQYAGADAIPGELASAGDRLVAVLIEVGIGIAGFLAVGLLSFAFRLVSDTLAGVVSGIGFLALWVFFLITQIMGEGRLGQSYGRHLAGLKVVSLRDGRPIGSPAAFGRLIVRSLGAYVFGLGLLWILWDDKRQGWHDKALNTVVIKAPSGRKLDPVAYFRAIFAAKR